MPLGSMQEAFASGELDLGLEYASKYVAAIDRGLAVTVLAGAHVGCFEVRSEDSSVAMIAGSYPQRSRVQHSVANHCVVRASRSLSRACTAKVKLAKDPYAEGAPGRLGARWP
jgi:hypothetical protein